MKTKQKLFKWVKEHKLICYSDVYRVKKRVKNLKFNKKEVMLDFEQQMLEV